MASWEDVREGLQRLLNPWLQPEPSSSSTITISNVRRLFQSRFQLELSVTALGHVRLLDVLKDSRLHDVCVVSSQRSGQLLVTKAECHQDLYPVSPPGVWDAAGAWDTAACTGFFQVPMLTLPFMSFVSQDDATAWEDVHSDCSGALLSPGASPRGCAASEQLWKSTESSISESTAVEESHDCNLSSGSSDDIEENLESPRCWSAQAKISACHSHGDIAGPWQIEVRNTFIDLKMGGDGHLRSGGGARQRSHSQPA